MKTMRWILAAVLALTMALFAGCSDGMINNSVTEGQPIRGAEDHNGLVNDGRNGNNSGMNNGGNDYDSNYRDGGVVDDIMDGVEDGLRDIGDDMTNGMRNGMNTIGDDNGTDLGNLSELPQLNR